MASLSKGSLVESIEKHNYITGQAHLMVLLHSGDWHDSFESRIPPDSGTD